MKVFVQAHQVKKFHHKKFQPILISTLNNNITHIGRIHKKSTIDEKLSLVTGIKEKIALEKEVTNSVNEDLKEPG